nr:immunoglobulin heavy chain junction region [Mus musculus]
CVRLRRIDYW